MIVKVPVILRVSDDPALETDLEFYFGIVWFIAGMYFKGVWSKSMINEWRISYFLTIVMMLRRYSNSASFLAPSGISTLPVVCIRFVKPILRNKLCAQCEESRSMWLKLYWGFVQLKPLRQIWRQQKIQVLRSFEGKVKISAHLIETVFHVVIHSNFY